MPGRGEAQGGDAAGAAEEDRGGHLEETSYKSYSQKRMDPRLGRREKPKKEREKTKKENGKTVQNFSKPCSPGNKLKSK